MRKYLIAVDRIWVWVWGGGDGKGLREFVLTRQGKWVELR